MRLIDADELKEQLIQRYEKAVEWRNETSSFYCERAEGAIAAFLEAIRTLNNAPTVDAVPVVRCRDCIDFVKGKDKLGEIRYCNLNSIYGCDENSFCSFGRKKR